MQRILYIFIWLSRITHCRGFGVQSPTDYWFVRHVVNEHGLYYQYDSVGCQDDWLTRRLGRLYFRLANWKQPKMICSDGYREYLHAGCLKSVFGDRGELIHLSLVGCDDSSLPSLFNKVNDDTLLIVEGIHQYPSLWRQLLADERVRVTFDLYYCGLVFFDKKRYKQNYIINF